MPRRWRCSRWQPSRWALAELVGLCDRRTRLQHWVLLAVTQELEARGLVIPPFRVEGAGLLAGPLTYVHPSRRMGDAQVHGILVGHVLIDVADPPRPVGDGVGVGRREDARGA